MVDQSGPPEIRLGLVCIDPLRIAGVQAIFSELKLEVVDMSLPGALDDITLSAVLIDAASTEHVFELLAAFRRTRPHLRLIVVGLEEDQAHIQRVIGAGAKGYLSHTAREDEIRMALKIVLDGSVWAPRKVLARLLETSAGPLPQTGPGKKVAITEREGQVLRLLVEGRPNREIAGILGIDEATVKSHVGRLMRKVGVETRISLSVEAVNKHLLA
jgi:DNA-binding NarL/FixJ family response regulator